MRTLTALLVVTLSGLVAAPAGAQTADYMPLKVGNKWTYKVDVSGQNLVITQKVTKIDKKGDQDVASVESELNGAIIATEQMSSNAKGVFRYSFNGIPVDPSLQVLRLPAKKGETWETEVTIMGQKAKVMMKTEGEEEITVPAGKYKTVVVITEFDLQGQAFKVTNWFAPNVGIAKQKFEIGAANGVSELEKVELAK